MTFAPLVAEPADLSDAELARHARTAAVAGLGIDGVGRLRAARVCIVGAGGLGSPLVAYLAASGVGHLTIIDSDVVEVHNLQRQVLHREGDAGRPKAESAARWVHEMDATTSVDARVMRLDADNAPGVFAGHHLVIDACDNQATRFVIDDAAAALDLPVVWGAVLGASAQVTVFWARHGLRLRDLQAPTEGIAGAAEVGALGPMVGVAGTLMAVEAVKLLTGLGEPLLGRVLFYDAVGARTAEIPLVPSTNQPSTRSPDA